MLQLKEKTRSTHCFLTAGAHIWKNIITQCHINFDWNISSWFPISGSSGNSCLLCLSREKPAQTKPWSEAHFGSLALSARSWSAASGESLSVPSSMCESCALLLPSLSLSAGNSKQALRCKTCKIAAHLWCTSELSQQACHGKVQKHSVNLMRHSCCVACCFLREGDGWLSQFLLFWKAKIIRNIYILKRGSKIIYTLLKMCYKCCFF